METFKRVVCTKKLIGYDSNIRIRNVKRLSRNFSSSCARSDFCSVLSLEILILTGNFLSECDKRCCEDIVIPQILKCYQSPKAKIADRSNNGGSIGCEFDVEYNLTFRCFHRDTPSEPAALDQGMYDIMVYMPLIHGETVMYSSSATIIRSVLYDMQTRISHMENMVSKYELKSSNPQPRCDLFLVVTCRADITICGLDMNCGEKVLKVGFKDDSFRYSELYCQLMLQSFASLIYSMQLESEVKRALGISNNVLLVQYHSVSIHHDRAMISMDKRGGLVNDIEAESCVIAGSNSEISYDIYPHVDFKGLRCTDNTIPNGCSVYCRRYMLNTAHIDSIPTPLSSTPAINPCVVEKSMRSSWDINGIVVITGGTGGLGLLTAKTIVESILLTEQVDVEGLETRSKIGNIHKKLKHLVLISRNCTVRFQELVKVNSDLAWLVRHTNCTLMRGSSFTDKESLHRQNHIQLHVIDCDVSDRLQVMGLRDKISHHCDEMQKEFWSSSESNPDGSCNYKGKSCLLGVIHTAGCLASDLSNENPDQYCDANIHKVWNAKALGAWYLHEYLLGGCEEAAHANDCNYKPAYFINYSSIASMIGNPGYGVYCMANGFLDGLVEYRNRMRAYSISIRWPPVRGIGMAADNHTDNSEYSVSCAEVQSLLIEVFKSLDESTMESSCDNAPTLLPVVFLRNLTEKVFSVSNNKLVYQHAIGVQFEGLIENEA